MDNNSNIDYAKTIENAKGEYKSGNKKIQELEGLLGESFNEHKSDPP